MPTGRNKCQSRESRALIQRILLKEWDPIGIGEMEGWETQYDDYAAKVYVMLMDDRAGEDEIARYLYEAAADRMGAKDPDIRARSNAAARSIVNIRPNLETH